MSLLLEALKKAEYKKQLLKNEKPAGAKSLDRPFVSEENTYIKESVNTDTEVGNDTAIEDQISSSWKLDNDEVETLPVSDELDLDLEIDPEFLDSDDNNNFSHNKVEETTAVVEKTVEKIDKKTEPTENTPSDSDKEVSDNTISENLAANHFDSNHSDIKDKPEYLQKTDNSNTDNAEQSSGNSVDIKEIEIPQELTSEKEKKSPEALSQLIHQQNTRYRRKRLSTIILMILIAIALVSASGYYFYTELLKKQILPQFDFLELFPQNSPENIQPDNLSQPTLPPPEPLPQEEKIAVRENITEKKSQLKLEENIEQLLELRVKQTVEEELNRRSKKLSAQQAAVSAISEQAVTGVLSQQNSDNEVTLIDDSDQATWAEVKLPNEVPNESQPQSKPIYENSNQRGGKSSNIFKMTKRNISNQVLLLTQKAYQKYNEGQLQESASLYQQVLDIKATYTDALLGLAAIAVQKDNVVRAKALYQQILLNEPDNSIASIALNQLNKSITPVKTEQQLKSQLQNDPESILLQASIGNFYASQQRWKLAQSHYFNAYSLDRNNIVYCYNLAISLDNLGKIPQAIKYYEKTLSLSNLLSLKKHKQVIPFDSNIIINRLKQLQEQSK